MGTNLHNIRFPISARIQRIKSMVDLRKTKRSQVYRSHRLRHFFASDDYIRQKFNTICQHLDLVGSHYTDEQKLTVLLLIMVGGDMPQIADFIRYELANELMRHINNELNVLISSICHIVAEINDYDAAAANNDDQHHHHDADANYHHSTAGQSIGARFENDNLTFRLNINSMHDLMIELLSVMLQSFGHRCQASKMPITITANVLRIFELCYERIAHNSIAIERNLNRAMFALTANGVGRLDRTKLIVEYHPLMRCLLNRMPVNFGGNGQDTLIILQIIYNLTNGFPENVEHLIRYNVLGHLRHHIVGNDCQAAHMIVEQCICILDNICGNHRSDIQAVVDSGLIVPIVNVFKTSEMYIGLRKLVLNIFISISALGNSKQIKALLDSDLLQLLCGQLYNRGGFNNTVIEMVLEIITNVFHELYRNDHLLYHETCSIFDDYGGFVAINQLSQYNNESVSNMAQHVNRYNGNNICKKCDRLPVSIEQMQQ